MTVLYDRDCMFVSNLTRFQRLPATSPVPVSDGADYAAPCHVRPQCGVTYGNSAEVPGLLVKLCAELCQAKPTWANSLEQSLDCLRNRSKSWVWPGRQGRQ